MTKVKPLSCETCSLCLPWFLNGKKEDWNFESLGNQTDCPFFLLNCFNMIEPKHYLGENAFKVGTHKKNSQHLLCAIHCHSQKQIIELPDIIFTTIPGPGFYYLQVLVERHEAYDLFQVKHVSRGESGSELGNPMSVSPLQPVLPKVCFPLQMRRWSALDKLPRWWECVRCIRAYKIPRDELSFQEKEKQVVREFRGGSDWLLLRDWGGGDQRSWRAHVGTTPWRMSRLGCQAGNRERAFKTAEKIQMQESSLFIWGETDQSYMHIAQGVS